MPKIIIELYTTAYDFPAAIDDKLSDEIEQWLIDNFDIPLKPRRQNRIYYNDADVIDRIYFDDPDEVNYFKLMFGGKVRMHEYAPSRKRA